VRVCFVSPYALGAVSGISTLLLDLGAELARRGHAATFVGPKGPPVQTDMEVLEIPLPARLKTAALARSSAAIVRRRAKDFAVVHVHQAHPQTWAAAKAAMASRLPVVTTIHLKTAAGANRLRRLADERARKGLFGRSDMLVFVSEDTRRQFGNPRGRVIPNGVGRQVLQAAAGDRAVARKAVGAGAAFLFLFAGRQSRIKGYGDVLAAAAALRRTRKDFTLMTTGASPEGERPALAALGRRLGDGLLALGERGRGEWTAFLAADAFLLPSYTEGMPMALLEAMAFSLPAIVTAVGGVPEVLDPEDARFVPPGDVPELTRAMAGFLDDPDRGRPLGKRGRARVDRSFTIQRCADQYLDLFETVTRTKVRPRETAAG